LLKPSKVFESVASTTLQMEVQMPMCDDEEVLLQSPDSRPESHRLRPCLFALATVAVASAGGRAWWTMSVAGSSTNVDDGSSLYSRYSWHPAWRSHHSQRFDPSGCTWDGDDCRSSRCCAKEGSRCFAKSRSWASCNETCHHYVRWEAGIDNRGRWAVTQLPVWDCMDLTVSDTHRVVSVAAPVAARTQPPQIEVVTTQPPQIEEVVTAPASTSRLGTYSIYQEKSDDESAVYGDRVLPKSSSTLAGEAHVSWEALP